MRIQHSLLQPLAAAALTAIAFSPVVAQGAAMREHSRPVVVVAKPADASAWRPVAIYLFQSPRNAGMPNRVTVADSSGQLAATFTLRGSNIARPMFLEMRDDDLVLEGDTPSGPLTLTFPQRKDSDARSGIVGRWWLNGQQGELLRAVR